MINLSVVVLLLNVSVADDCMNQLRKHYYKALNEATYCDSLLTGSKACAANPTAWAYEGVAWALKGKYTWSPAKKLDYLNRYEKLMSKAVAQDSTNTEARYLRYAVEKNLPGFLNRSQHLAQDQEFLTKKLIELNQEAAKQKKWKMIAEYLYKEATLTADEKNAIRTKFIDN